MGLIIKPGYWHPFDTHVITQWEKGVGNTKSTCHPTYLPTYLPTSLPTYQMQHETHPKDKAIFFIYIFMAFVTFFIFFPKYLLHRKESFTLEGLYKKVFFTKAFLSRF